MTAIDVSLLTLLATAFGWLFTYLKQKEQLNEIHKFKIFLSEHDTRFSHLHKRRAEVIDSLYKSIDNVLARLQGTVRQIRLICDPSPEEQRTEAFKHFITLQECFYQNRLYFDEEICEPIENYLKQCLIAVNKIDTAFSLRSITEGAAFNCDTAIFEDRKTLMEEASSIILTELPNIQGLIEKKMRHLLGDFP